MQDSTYIHVLWIPAIHAGMTCLFELFESILTDSSLSSKVEGNIAETNDLWLSPVIPARRGGHGSCAWVFANRRSSLQPRPMPLLETRVMRGGVFEVRDLALG